MSAYVVKGKFAVVTGAGSGINLAFVELLLQSGRSVILGDIGLRPEAEATIARYSKGSAGTHGVYAIFHKTDVSDWNQISSL
ncbi:hypothetical protein Landi51_13173 [Colletotrichum acutatum]